MSNLVPYAFVSEKCKTVDFSETIVVYDLKVATDDHEKSSIKSDLKQIFLNLQQMIEVTRCSCCHQNFVPKGLSAPAPGLYTCIKA